ncbi:hypothetical protein AB3X96_39835 [Paraburkholderia sp. BR13439]|uniref:hypothetical protein n=1 Tax=Paraburkholderia TaxID=1822464 RepID=UPI0034CD5663
MKLHDNALRLIEYLHDNAPATVAQIALNGVLNARDASVAIQYGIQRGVFERIRHPGAKSGERVQYRLTGRPLSHGKDQVCAPSFDALLAAWGIVSVSPEWPDERKQVVSAN